MYLTYAPLTRVTRPSPAACLHLLGMRMKVWAMLAELPYEDRFMLYGAWRGHGMEKHALGVKHVQFAVAEVGLFV